MKTITFRSGDTFCAADLYLPSSDCTNGRFPAIILGQGFSGVKELLQSEAQYFADSGYIALAIDYRSFGASGGEPRAQAFPLNQVEDLRNAISYLETREDVCADRIGLWAVSFGGGVGIYAAAFDRRVKATVVQMPIVDGRRWMRDLRNPEQFEHLLDRADADRRERFRSGTGARVPVSKTFKSGEFCAMPADDEIVGFAEQAKAAAPSRISDVTLESVEKLLEWRPCDVIHFIAPRPLCIVAASGHDIIHPINSILEAYQRAREPKQIHLIPCGQMDLYVEPFLKIGMQHAIMWFDSYLNVTI